MVLKTAFGLVFRSLAGISSEDMGFLCMEMSTVHAIYRTDLHQMSQYMYLWKFARVLLMEKEVLKICAIRANSTSFYIKKTASFNCQFKGVGVISLVPKASNIRHCSLCTTLNPKDPKHTFFLQRSKMRPFRYLKTCSGNYNEEK